MLMFDETEAMCQSGMNTYKTQIDKIPANLETLSTTNDYYHILYDNNKGFDFCTTVPFFNFSLVAYKFKDIYNFCLVVFLEVG
jgi:hypothetical protein